MVETIVRSNSNESNGTLATGARTNKSAQLVAELRAKFMSEYEAHKYDGKSNFNLLFRPQIVFFLLSLFPSPSCRYLRRS